MKTTRFFRNLRRINSVLALIASVLAIAVFVVFIIELMDFSHHDSEQVVHVNSKPEKPDKPPVLTSFNTVSGTSIMHADLTFGDRYSSSSFGKSRSYSTRNCLFLNSTTLQAHWLFPNNKQLIISSDELFIPTLKKPLHDSKYQTIAFFYQVINTDTSEDNQLTLDDTLTIAYSKPNGHGYTNVINGIDRLLFTDIIEKGTKHIIIYEINKKWFTAVISLTTFEIEDTKELPVK